MSTPEQNNEAPKGATNQQKPDAGEESTAMKPGGQPSPPNGENAIDFILDIPLEISVVLGETKMVVSDLLKLGQGSIIELTKLAGETLDVRANQKLIARGEVVSVDEKYGIRITEIVSPAERIAKLG